MLNKVMLIGSLVADPETRFMQDKTCVCNIRMATTETWKDRATGQKQERTEWHRVELWGRLGEVANQYLRKGNRVYVEGSIRTEKWTDKQGQERYTTKIRASEMKMLERRGGSNQQQPPQPPQPPFPTHGGMPQRQKQTPRQQLANPFGDQHSIEGDMPF